MPPSTTGWRRAESGPSPRTMTPKPKILPPAKPSKPLTPAKPHGNAGRKKAFSGKKTKGFGY